MKRFFYKILKTVLEKLIRMYTDYQVESITNILKNKVCNNSYTHDKISISQNSELNKLIYEIETEICSFDLSITYDTHRKESIFKTGTLTPNPAYDFNDFTNEISEFNRKLNMFKEEINSYFIALKQNYPNG